MSVCVYHSDMIIVEPGREARYQEQNAMTVGKLSREKQRKVREEPGVRHLGENEIQAVLREVGWGLLGTDDEGQPYAVPIGYGFDGTCIYFGTGPGRKLRALERNPRVCLTVIEVLSLEAWVSVIITGRVEWLEGMVERALATGALVAQRRPGRRPGIEHLPRLLRARLARIVVDVMTGRRSTAHPEISPE